MNCVINTVHRVVKVIRAVIQCQQAIGAQYRTATAEARNKDHIIARAVVHALDLVHMTQGGRNATNRRIDVIAVTVLSIEEAQNGANDVPHRETIDAEVNQLNVDATMIDQKN